MFKTLGGLVVCMAAGSFVLASFKPAALRSLTQSPILLHARGQSEPGQRAPDYARWEAVRVICSSTAAQPAVPAHVIINEDGTLIVNPAWRQIRPSAGVPHYLLIRFDVDPRAALYSQEQFQSIRDLLMVLEQETDLPVDHFYFESRHPRIKSMQEHL